MGKTLLIISGGIESIPCIKKAIEMGLYVVVTDGNPDAPGFKYANDFLLASTYDIDQTLDVVSNYHEKYRNIDGVICCASDVPLTVASVAKKLNIPGIDIKSAKLAIDKLAMKINFKKSGLAIPWFSSVESIEHLKSLVLEKGIPLVLKPIDSRGSRGVLLLDENVDLKWAFNFSQHYSPSKKLILEKFLPGPQLSTESIIINGIAYTVGFSDRNYQYLERYKPHIIENGGQLPSQLNKKTIDLVCNLIQEASNSIGIANGIIKGDIVIHNDVPHVIEVAARLSGGYFCSHEIPLNTGIDFLSLAIRQSLGEEINISSLKPKENRPVAQRYWFPKQGVVSSVEGLELYEFNENVELLEIRVKEGDEIRPIYNHPARAGVVITKGKTLEQAIFLAEEVVKNVKINIKEF